MRRESIHAVFSAWFDLTDEEHKAKIKPYAIRTIGLGSRHGIVEITIIRDEAEVELLRAAKPQTQLEFDGQVATISSAPACIERARWSELATSTAARAWCMRFLTPTTFRTRNRSSPWVAPEVVLHGLADRWRRWSPLSPIELTRRDAHSVWVSDIEGVNEVFRLSGNVVSGFVGRIRYQCDDASVASSVDRLMRFAPYIGVGASTTKGLGVVRLEPTWAPSKRNGKPGR